MSRLARALLDDGACVLRPQSRVFLESPGVCAQRRFPAGAPPPCFTQSVPLARSLAPVLVSAFPYAICTNYERGRYLGSWARGCGFDHFCFSCGACNRRRSCTGGASDWSTWRITTGACASDAALPRCPTRVHKPPLCVLSAGIGEVVVRGERGSGEPRARIVACFSHKSSQVCC